MAMSKAERWQRIHDTAIRDFDKTQTALRDERLQCLQDRRFYSIAGAQWEGPLGVQFENKPRFEVNKIHLSVIRIFNEYRNNRIDATFVSRDGEDADQLADTCASLYRATEQHSNAEEAYDNAFEEAVGGGFGAWRLRAQYADEEDDENEDQIICIEPIYDADSSVFFDLNAKRQDKADATRCWVLTSMTRDAYIEEYDDDPTSWPKQVYQIQFDWLTPDVVYVAEYYVVEQLSSIIHIYKGLDGSEERYSDDDFENDPALEETLRATGFREVRQKKVKRKRVHKYVMSGGKILEDCGYLAGKNIPIIPVYGKRWFVDNVERCMGHVRLAKDPQRLKNMQLSKLGEIAGASAYSKPIFSPEQINGHQQMWADDNLRNYPYLLINQLTDAAGNIQAVGPTQYSHAPDIPPAMAALLQLTETDMQDVLGKTQNGDEMKSNISGQTVELIQTRLDMQTYIYVSNFAKAIKRSAEVWLSMAQEVYVEAGRKLRGVGPQGESNSIELLRPTTSASGTGVDFDNDLSKADFEVSVEVGPSSMSRKAATIRALTNVLGITQDAETANILTSLVMLNMEGEGVGDVREYFRKKLVTSGVLDPTEEDTKRMQEQAQNAQNQQPDPQSQALMAMAQQSQAAAQKARADTILAIAKAEQTKAATVKTMSETNIGAQKHVVDLVNHLSAVPQGGETQPAMPQNPGPHPSGLIG